MKTFVAQSQINPESFYKESVNWQSLLNGALAYYGVDNLYYKEVRADDFLIDAMLRLVGTIRLSLHPNSEPVFYIATKQTDVDRNGYQTHLDFNETIVEEKAPVYK